MLWNDWSTFDLWFYCGSERNHPVVSHIIDRNMWWPQHNKGKKSKGLPQQVELAKGVPGRLRSRIILTFWHCRGGRSSTKSTGRLYPRRNPWYSLSEAESTSGQMVLSGVPRKMSPVTLPGIDPGTVRLVAQCLNHYATPGIHAELHSDLQMEIATN